MEVCARSMVLLFLKPEQQLPTDRIPWLFFGTLVNTTNTLRINSCNNNVPYSTVDADALQYLGHQFNTYD
jgi:hypothetical protein